jgi:zona occludens toxin
MISIITGLPGAGKTSWLVEQVLMKLAAKGWEEKAVDSDGNPVTVKRRLFTNVKGLLLEHELIGEDELNSWPDWVKPGDIIVFDEIQKPWPKVPAGTKKPKCISELETHRHYGIDIYGLTQHPNLVNDALVTLAGQHKHVRKVGNSRFATVYEWDGVSRTLLYKNSVSKSPWRRGKEVEKMYRSSALHTKQKRTLPTVLWIVLLCLIGLPIGFYQYSGKFKERFFGEKPTAMVASAHTTKGDSQVKAPPALDQVEPKTPPAVPAVIPATPGHVDQKPIVFAGCARIRERCQCFDTAGQPVEKEKLYCEDLTRVATGLGEAIKHLPEARPFGEETAEKVLLSRADSEALSFIAQRRETTAKVR